MTRALPILLLLATSLPACSDEGIAAYAPSGTVWKLAELEGEPVGARITLELASKAISGQAPCNRYSATQEAPAPWFKAGPVLATKRACRELPLEQAFFHALAAARLAEASQSELVLADEANRPLLRFVAER